MNLVHVNFSRRYNFVQALFTMYVGNDEVSLLNTNVNFIHTGTRTHTQMYIPRTQMHPLPLYTRKHSRLHVRIISKLFIQGISHLAKPFHVI